MRLMRPEPIVALDKREEEEVKMAATTVDSDRLEQFVFRAVNEVGATLNAALVVMGDKLGLYEALVDEGPMNPAELAAEASIS